MAGTQLTPARLILDNVPWVGFWQGGVRCPEDICFPSCLRAALEYLGDPQVGCNTARAFGVEGAWHLGCTYGFHLVTSGIAFQQLWHPTDWGWADEPVRLTPEPLGPFRHAIEATGYGFEVVTNPAAKQSSPLHAALGPPADEDEFRRRLAESLAEGRPVLALGVVGPPECGLVTGYDEGGDVLIGRSFFQHSPEGDAGLESEISGYYRKRDWSADTQAIITLGTRGERPKLADSLRAAYERGTRLVHMPMVNGHHSGLAALEAWATALERDTEYDVDWPTLRARYERHHGTVGLVAEGRWYASVLISRHANCEDRIAEHLLAASACYARMHRLMWDVWGCAGGIGVDDDKVREGTTPEARRRMAALIRRARDADAEAAEHLTRAVSP